MKIHTTQNLELSNRNISANNKFNNKNVTFSLRNDATNSINEPESTSMSSITFKKKLPKNSENAKKIVDMAKKGFKDIKDKAMPEIEKGDSVYKSSFFNFWLKLAASNEAVFSAASAAVVCIGLRPLAIMALPSGNSKPKSKVEDDKNKKDENKSLDTKKENSVAELSSKENQAPSFKANDIVFKGGKKERSAKKTNNMYAAAQSISSGLAGVVAAIVVTKPFKGGADYVTKNIHKFLSAKKIKKMYPWVKESSMIGVDGKLLPMDEWKNAADGLKFVSDMKGCAMLPEFRKLADCSKETFEKILKLDIDFTKQKTSSFNDVVTKNNKKLYDVIDFNKVGIVVKEEGFGDTQILLKDLDKSYLEKLIADSKGVNEWGNLDINSVYENGIVKDFRNWKSLESKKWKLDLDTIGIPSELETTNYKPRFSGEKRFDKLDQEWKFVAHLDNGINGGLGTRITSDMVEADATNSVLIKCLTWLPDLTFRVPIAVGTIALIPWVLKNVFGLEKVKPATPQKENNVENLKNKKTEEKVNFKANKIKKQSEAVSFKGGQPNPEKASWLIKILARWYGKPLMESPNMKKFCNWLLKLPGDASEHIVVLGSLIQSGVYVNRTLSNKELDEDRKKTLAINQGLCFVIPTFAGYIVNNALNGVIKKAGYRYKNLMTQKIAELKNAGNEKAAHEAAVMADKLPKNVRAVGALARLATFTLIYRFLTPVLVTPIANKLGDKYFSKKNS